jgi:hypothetical protein
MLLLLLLLSVYISAPNPTIIWYGNPMVRPSDSLFNRLDFQCFDKPILGQMFQQASKQAN